MKDYPNLEKLHQFVSQARYMVLATVSADGSPLATPVFFVQGRELKYYWLSSPDAIHSQNIDRTGLVAATIFDSHAEQGTGVALYFNGRAGRVTREENPAYQKGEYDYALNLLCGKGPNLPPKEKLADPDCPRIVYFAQISSASYNGAELVDGIWVDKRKEWLTTSEDHRYLLNTKPSSP